jgi:hypothetical protein
MILTVYMSDFLIYKYQMKIALLDTEKWVR